MKKIFLMGITLLMVALLPVYSNDIQDDSNLSEVGADGIVIYNKGVSGNTSTNILARTKRDVVEIEPDLTILMVGTNDLLNSKKVVSYDKYRENLTEIIEQIKSCGSEVMLISSLPADSEYLFERHDKTKYAGHPDEVMAEASKIVKRLAKKHKCYFVDLHGEFVKRGIPQHNEDIYIRNEKNSKVRDGVHPTPEGYELIGDIIWAYLQRHKLQTKYKRIVCIGDSITRGGSTTVTASGTNYPSHLNRKLNRQ